MADGNDSGMGVLGVVIGVLVVLLVGGAILYGMGAFGPSGGGGTANVKIEAPRVPTPSK